MTTTIEKILWFSRGRGRGHAVVDIPIAQLVRSRIPEVQITFASYATGLSVFTEAQEQIIDLKLPERNSFSDTVVAAARLIDLLDPSFVVSHEELAALPASKIFNKPTVYLTHWFAPVSHSINSTLLYADAILFMEGQGLFAEPRQAIGKVQYCGAVTRELSFDPGRRDEARASLGLEDDELFILVAPGSPPEAEAPIFDLVSAVYDGFNEKKRLLWITGSDDTILSRSSQVPNRFEFLSYHDQLHQMMVASDLVIIKGTYNILKELELLNVPSITISHEGNPIDDFYAKRSSTNVFLVRRELTPDKLLATAKRIVRARNMHPLPKSGGGSGGATEIAECLIKQLLR